MSPQDENIIIEEMFKEKFFSPKDKDQKHIIDQFWELIGMDEFEAAGIVFMSYWETIRNECLEKRIVLRRDDVIHICRKIIGENANEVYLETIMNDPNFVTFYRIETNQQRKQEYTQITENDEKALFERKSEIIRVVRASFIKTLDQNLRQYDRFQFTFIEELGKLLNELEKQGLPVTATELKNIIKKDVPILRSMEQELSIIDKFEARLQAIKEKPKEKIIDEAQEKRREQLEKEIDEDWVEIEEIEKRAAVKRRLSDSQFTSLLLKEVNYLQSAQNPDMANIELIISLKGVKEYFENTFFNIPEGSYKQKITDALRKATIHCRDEKGIDGLKILAEILFKLNKGYSKNKEKETTRLLQLAQTKKYAENAANARKKLEHIISALQSQWAFLEEIILKG